MEDFKVADSFGCILIDELRLHSATASACQACEYTQTKLFTL